MRQGTKQIHSIIGDGERDAPRRVMTIDPRPPRLERIRFAAQHDELRRIELILQSGQ